MHNARQFVTAVHRRLVILRIVEQLGLGFFFASILAVGLLGIAIWQSMPTIPIVIFCTAIGIVSGSVLAILRWPARAAAALAADRQLHFEDLLTTVLSSIQASDKDFIAAVTAIADARCRAHSPSEVVLRQFGIRRWSGIALTMCIATTLAAITLTPTKSQANDANVSVLSSDTIGMIHAQTDDQQSGESSVTNNPKSDSGSRDLQSTESPPGKTSGVANPASNTNRSGNLGGSNGGSAATDATSDRKLKSADAWSYPDHSGGIAAGGGSESDHRGKSGENQISGAAKSTHQSSAVPAWAQGDQHFGSAANPGQDNQLPAADRDLIRDFFSHQ